MCPPAERVDREEFPLERVEHRKIPVDDMDLQRLAAPRERIEEFAEHCGQIGGVVARKKRCTTVDVPADDEYRPLCALGSSAESRKVGFAVDQECDPLCAHDAPAVPSDAEYLPVDDQIFSAFRRRRRGGSFTGGLSSSGGSIGGSSDSGSSTGVRRLRRGSSAGGGSEPGSFIGARRRCAAFESLTGWIGVVKVWIIEGD
jgi:hypothetical protein